MKKALRMVGTIERKKAAPKYVASFFPDSGSPDENLAYTMIAPTNPTIAPITSMRLAAAVK